MLMAPKDGIFSYGTLDTGSPSVAEFDETQYGIQGLVKTA